MLILYSLEPPVWGGSKEYPQSMWNKKNNVYPCKSQFHYIKVGLSLKLWIIQTIIVIYSKTIFNQIPLVYLDQTIFMLQKSGT